MGAGGHSDFLLSLSLNIEVDTHDQDMCLFVSFTQPLIEERLGSERTHWQRLRLSHFMRGFNWEAIFCQGAPVPQRILEFHQKDAKEGVPHVTKIHEEPGRRVCYLEELKERSREKSAEFSGIFDSFFYKF